MNSKMMKPLVLKDLQELLQLLGPLDQNVSLLKKHYPVQIFTRQNTLLIKGKKGDVSKAHTALSYLLTRIREGTPASAEDTEKILLSPLPSPAFASSTPFLHPLPHPRKKTKGIKEDDSSPSSLPIPFPSSLRNHAAIPQTPGQVLYVQAMEKNPLVLAVGPAGTGKTFLAVYYALQSLMSGQVKKIVLCRPAVEAGERLGYLPGTFEEKINPYLRPLYDALGSWLDVGQLQKLMSMDIVEVAPLAYMRGRTLDYAFIILDEAQNATSEQMRMFLTRMGRSSKIVVTGDITQTDLAKPRIPGLVEALHLLKGIEGIQFVYLSKEDIVRHPLVQKIVEAYEKRSAPVHQ